MLDLCRPVVGTSDKLRQLNQAIAHELNTDKDIAAYRLICRGTNDAIDADRGSFWRTKFRAKFAFKEGLSNKELKRLYQRRTKQLRRGTGYDFFWGYRKREMDVVAVLKELIIGKFTILRPSREVQAKCYCAR
jgi:hypothetical protein